MNALAHLGAQARFVRGPEELVAPAGKAPFEKLVFPGDGHFGTAMASLNRSGYAEAIREWIRADKPFLGICIGLQLLFDSSEETLPEVGEEGESGCGTTHPVSNRPFHSEGKAESACSTTPPASNRPFHSESKAESTCGAGLAVIRGAVKRFPGRKLPQIGWNRTEARRGSCLFRGLPENVHFYYIHSYYAAPEDESVTAAVSDYYISFCAAIERGALCAAQFHPEKSGDAGLRLLENWLRKR
jgi:imidazoleglycerol phosphate synthase glutamine amidotransferase subunit HisH